MRRLPALLALALFAAAPARAQKDRPAEAAPMRPVEGRALVLRWPESQRPISAAQQRRFAALPLLDTLQVGYRFTPSGAQTVDLDLAVRWVPGSTGILRGQRVAFSQMPEGLRLVAFTVQADVMQRGRRVATFTYAADSTRLAARDVFADRLAVPLARVFDGLSADEARRVLSGGFTLDRLRLTRAVFTVPADAMPAGKAGGSASARPGAVGRDEVARQERRARTSDRDFWLTVYTIDRALDLAAYAAWMQDAYDRYADDDRRGELLGYAVGAAATVGAVAYWGGAAGVYGTGDTPLGLAGGYARPGGGLLLQASANLAALGATSGVERLDLRAVGYARLGAFPVMPMLATGVRLTDRSGPAYRPAHDESRWLFSLGAAHNIGAATVLAGVEVLSGTPEVGVLWRWR